MTLEPATRAQLTKLLLDLFGDAREVAGFLRSLGERELLQALPSELSAQDDFVDRLIQLLERRDPPADFFATLANRSPGRRAEIVAVARACGVEVAPLRSPLAGVTLDGLLSPILPHVGPRGRAALPAGDLEFARRLLNAGRLPRPRHPNPGALLNARHAEVPFHAWLRGRELASLHAWCTGDDPVAVTVIHGPGGAGKTRLALELCERLTAEGFVAGLVSTAVPTGALDGLLAVDGRLLVVLDYAETRAGLGEWLDRVALLRLEATQCLRVVLIVRNLGDWWDALRERGSEVRALLARDPSIVLRPESLPPSARARAFSEAAAHFARADPIVPPPAPPAEIADAEFGNLLYLHMSALAAIEGRSTRGEHLLAETRLRERSFWLIGIAASDETTRRRYGRQIDQAMAALILAGGAIDRDAALRLLSRAGVEEPLREPLLLRLGDLYPGTGERDLGDAYLAPLAPDLLAEAHVEAVLAHRETPANFVAGLFADARPEALRPALQWLGRLDKHGRGSEVLLAAFRDLLTEDLPGRAPVALEVAINFAERSLSSRLVDVLGEAVQARGTPRIAAQLLRVANLRSIALHRVRGWIYETVLAASPSPEPDSRFIASVGLAALRTERGGHAEAKLLCNNAIEAAREWARTDNSALWASALGLGLLGTVAGENGEREQALAMMREGLALFETVRRAAPGEHGDLELFLRMMYGHALMQVGALTAAHIELVAVAASYDALSGPTPAPATSEHALCLFVLGVSCGELERYKEAAVHLRRAVVFQRELTIARRGDHIAELARSLGWLAGIEIRLGAFDDASAVARESVQLWEEVQRADPELASSGLGVALANLAAAANVLGEHAEARACTRRSVALWRSVYAMTPAFGAPMLASALGTLGNVLVDAADAAEAFAAFEEALALYQPLVDQHPLVYSPCIARILLLRGQRSLLVGDVVAALPTLDAATTAYSALPGESGAAHSLEWGLAFFLQIEPLGELGRRDDAMACARSTLEILQNPRAEVGLFHDLLIGATYYFRGLMLAEVDADDAATAALQASLAPLRRAGDVRPEAAGLLSSALVVLAEYLPELGSAREAALLEVVRLQHGFLAAGQPPGFELADSLFELASFYLQRDDPARAAVMLSEARPLMTRHFAEASEEQEGQLVHWFSALAEMDPDEHARREHLRNLESLFLRKLVGDEAKMLARMGRMLDASASFMGTGRSAAAVLAARTVIQACEASDGPEFLLMSARAHETHAELLRLLGRRSDRVLALQGALAARRRLDALAPEVHRAGLLACMHALAAALANAWMGEQARRLRAEARALRKGR